MRKILPLLALAITLPVRAADAPWVSLFNGRDLAGWKTGKSLND